jgi:hypothetical protein
MNPLQVQASRCTNSILDVVVGLERQWRKEGLETEREREKERMLK